MSCLDTRSCLFLLRKLEARPLTTFNTWTQSQFKVKMAANTLIPDYKVGNKNQFDSKETKYQTRFFTIRN